jgi:hypothetical protein
MHSTRPLIMTNLEASSKVLLVEMKRGIPINPSKEASGVL